jgi:hypothetical protein
MDRYGYIEQEEINKLPRATQDDIEFIERMEELLKIHDDYILQLANNAAQSKIIAKDARNKRNKNRRNYSADDESDNDDYENAVSCGDGNDDDDEDDDDDDCNSGNNDTVNKSGAKNKGPSSRRQKGAGRKTNGLFPFDIRHPYFGSHIQVLRSKLIIPTIFGSIPRLPAVLSNKTLEAQAKVALFMLTLFKPWDIVTGVPCEDISWESYLQYLRFLVSPETSDFTSNGVIFIMNNILESCRVSAIKRRAINIYRKSEVIPWSRVHELAKLGTVYIDSFYEEVKKQVAELSEHEKEIFDNIEDIIPMFSDLEAAEQEASKEGFQMDNLGFTAFDGEDEEAKLTQDNMDNFMFDIMQQNISFDDRSSNILTAGRKQAVQYVSQSISAIRDIYQPIFDDADMFDSVKKS